MNDDAIANWLRLKVSKRVPTFSGLSEAEQYSIDLFDSQVLDSMVLMDLLISAEETFEFRFTSDSFLDDRIRTIQGIAAIAQELKA